MILNPPPKSDEFGEGSDRQKEHNAQSLLKIVNEYGLVATRVAFVEAMVSASENYYDWHDDNPTKTFGLGTAREVKALIRALHRSSGLLKGETSPTA